MFLFNDYEENYPTIILIIKQSVEKDNKPAYTCTMPLHHGLNESKAMWPFPPFPNPKDKGHKRPKFNPDNFEDAPL